MSNVRTLGNKPTGLHAREAASVLDGILALPETPEAAYDAEHDGAADAEDIAPEALPA